MNRLVHPRFMHLVSLLLALLFSFVAVQAQTTTFTYLVNAATQFNLNGNRVLSSPAENLFVGLGAGNQNTPGLRNAFFGQNAGSSITTGFDNSFFGRQAGLNNNVGILNSFFGSEAGAVNQTGSRNTFGGAGAGRSNNTGGSNSFFGQPVGTMNTTGSANSFFGASAGEVNTTGSLNTFSGAGSGDNNTMGNSNSYFGRAAGRGNSTGSKNTSVGDAARFGADNLTNATAIGADAVVSANNALVLGSISGVNGATSDTAVGIGTTTPSGNLDVVSASTAQINGTAHNSIALFLGQRADGTRAAETAVSAGSLAIFGARGHQGQGFSGIRAAMQMFASENFSSSANGTEITFENPANGTTSRVERMRIAQNGNIGIGTNAPPIPLTVQTPTNAFGIGHTDGNVQLSTAMVTTGGTSVANFGTASNHQLQFTTNNTPRMAD
ncbi:MAG: hypothetical protein ACREEM_38405 [Blastocatellia bacterium]